MKDSGYDGGIYLLEILLESKKEITVGKLGEYIFPAGYYYYVGTAQRRLHSRLKRHLSKNKKLRWHIDYLIDKAKVIKYYTWNVGRDQECILSQVLKNFLGGDAIIPGFGASDCKCKSHLYYFSRPLHKEDLIQGDCFLITC